MSILSEYQIGDILDICNVCASSRQAKELRDWNEKQALSVEQFEPDWSKAPKSAFMATINISWLTENGSWTLGYRAATYERPEPVITPHPHAELMMKYAEVAQRRVDPWVEFEFKSLESEPWEKPTVNVSFYDNWQYRHIGEQQ